MEIIALAKAEIDDGVKYRAEIERLRAALIKISESCPPGNVGRINDHDHAFTLHSYTLHSYIRHILARVA